MIGFLKWMVIAVAGATELMVGVMPAAAADAGVNNAAHFWSEESLTCGIQEAINALSENGGAVIIPPGTHILKTSIRLKDNVIIRGYGPGTILKNASVFQARMAADAPRGSRRIKVDDGGGFRKGMVVTIFCGTGGQRAPVHNLAVIQDIDGDTMVLEEAVKDDFIADDFAAVATYFPAIWMYRNRNVQVSDVTIEGAFHVNSILAKTFMSSGILCVHSRSIRIENCTIRDWLSDGITIAAGGDVWVGGCEVSGCRYGLHPGSGVKNVIFSHNIIHHNTAHGFYFCHKVQNTVLNGNILYENGGDGIAALGGNSDECNVLYGNICDSNGRYGLFMGESRNNLVANNIFRGNGTNQTAAYPGIKIEKSGGNILLGNLLSVGKGDGSKSRVVSVIKLDSNDGSNIIMGNSVLSSGEP